MIADTVSISLHNSLAPYNMEFNQQTVLDTSGNCQVTFPGSIWTDSYYIVVRHRNSLETWSKQPITFGAVNYFDFTAIPSAPLFNSTLRKQ